ncbi:hypothetical protein AB1Y20_021694 [Prymnesium parvum]|uniref:Rad21/Rec8-like protein C-terminal eukaryotic domain-containing protein n=1 Tax=Prymnesium parvum TaxID=97485 RepID=A0AB34JKH9_PRYPA
MAYRAVRTPVALRLSAVFLYGSVKAHQHQASSTQLVLPASVQCGVHTESVSIPQTITLLTAVTELSFKVRDFMKKYGDAGSVSLGKPTASLASITFPWLDHPIEDVDHPDAVEISAMDLDHTFLHVAAWEDVVDFSGTEMMATSAANSEDLSSNQGWEAASDPMSDLRDLYPPAQEDQLGRLSLHEAADFFADDLGQAGYDGLVVTPLVSSSLSVPEVEKGPADQRRSEETHKPTSDSPTRHRDDEDRFPDLDNDDCSEGGDVPPPPPPTSDDKGQFRQRDDSPSRHRANKRMKFDNARLLPERTPRRASSTTAHSSIVRAARLNPTSCNCNGQHAHCTRSSSLEQAASRSALLTVPQVRSIEELAAQRRVNLRHTSQKGFLKLAHALSLPPGCLRWSKPTSRLRRIVWKAIVSRARAGQLATQPCGKHTLHPAPKFDPTTSMHATRDDVDDKVSHPRLESPQPLETRRHLDGDSLEGSAGIPDLQFTSFEADDDFDDGYTMPDVPAELRSGLSVDSAKQVRASSLDGESEFRMSRGSLAALQIPDEYRLSACFESTRLSPESEHMSSRRPRSPASIPGVLSVRAHRLLQRVSRLLKSVHDSLDFSQSILYRASSRREVAILFSTLLELFQSDALRCESQRIPYSPIIVMQGEEFLKAMGDFPDVPGIAASILE